MRTVFPLSATLFPKKSPAAASLAVSLASWFQLAPLPTNTNAEPESEAGASSSMAPMRAVSSLSATEVPKRFAPPLAVSLAASFQLLPVRTKM